MYIYVHTHTHIYIGFLGGLVVKNLPANAGDTGSIPGSGSSLGEGHVNPIQYPCLGIPMDREAWWATVHGVTKSQTWLSMQAWKYIYGGGLLPKSCPNLLTQWTVAHGISQARILEWVAISFSRVSSWPRDQTRASWIAGRFFTDWATKEVQEIVLIPTSI